MWDVLGVIEHTAEFLYLTLEEGDLSAQLQVLLLQVDDAHGDLLFLHTASVSRPLGRVVVLLALLPVPVVLLGLGHLVRPLLGRHAEAVAGVRLVVVVVGVGRRRGVRGRRAAPVAGGAGAGRAGTLLGRRGGRLLGVRGRGLGLGHQVRRRRGVVLLRRLRGVMLGRHHLLGMSSAHGDSRRRLAVAVAVAVAAHHRVVVHGHLLRVGHRQMSHAGLLLFDMRAQHTHAPRRVPHRRRGAVGRRLGNIHQAGHSVQVRRRA